MSSDVINNTPNAKKQLFSGRASIFGRNDSESSCHHLLSMAKEILDDMKGVFHTRPDAGFQSLRVLGQSFDSSSSRKECLWPPCALESQGFIGFREHGQEEQIRIGQMKTKG